MAENPLGWHWLLSELERLQEDEPEHVSWREWKACEQCGEQMLTWRPTQKYCSKDCRGAAERAAKGYPVEQWAKAYREGKTYRQIAAAWDVSYAVVRRNVQKFGEPPRTDYEHLVKLNSHA